MEDSQLPNPCCPDSDQDPTLTEPVQSSITVVDTVYHLPFDGSPSTILGDASRFSRPLNSEEQPFERHKTIVTEWEPLDFGWIDKCGMLVLRNDEGKFFINPTEGQRAEVFSRIIEISFDGINPAILVPPRETCRFYPSDLKQIWLRCQNQKAKYSFSLIPE